MQAENSEVRIQNVCFDLAVAPSTVPADAGPISSLEVGNEFGEITFVFGDADEAADAMSLAGAAAAAFYGDVVQYTTHRLHRSSSFGQSAKIDFKRPCSVQGTQGAQSIASARQERGEIGIGSAGSSFQFRWCLKLDSDAPDWHGLRM